MFLAIKFLSRETNSVSIVFMNNANKTKTYTMERNSTVGLYDIYETENGWSKRIECFTNKRKAQKRLRELTQGKATQPITSLNAAQVASLRTLIQEKLPMIEHLIRPDAGTCIMGEGIRIVHTPPRCRKPRFENVFTQRWTQGDQPKAIRALIDLVLREVPEWKDCISYNPGRMD
jgi:hypothetical protein